MRTTVRHSILGLAVLGLLGIIAVQPTELLASLFFFRQSDQPIGQFSL